MIGFRTIRRTVAVTVTLVAFASGMAMAASDQAKVASGSDAASAAAAKQARKAKPPQAGSQAASVL